MVLNKNIIAKEQKQTDNNKNIKVTKKKNTLNIKL